MGGNHCAQFTDEIEFLSDLLRVADPVITCTKLAGCLLVSNRGAPPR